jgi:hypothetical protein
MNETVIYQFILFYKLNKKVRDEKMIDYLISYKLNKKMRGEKMIDYYLIS